MDTEDARQRAQHWRPLARDLAGDQMREKLIDLATQCDQTAEAMEHHKVGRSDKEAAG